MGYTQQLIATVFQIEQTWMQVHRSPVSIVNSSNMYESALEDTSSQCTQEVGKVLLGILMTTMVAGHHTRTQIQKKTFFHKQNNDVT